MSDAMLWLALGLWLALAWFVARDCMPPRLTAYERGHAAGLISAAAWVEDATDRLAHGTPEYRWLMGSAHFLRQLAEEGRTRTIPRWQRET